jgi:class 3 adenylate cyclase
MAEKGFKRKLAAILSADVEGYSRLMDDDEEATVRTLTSYRTAIADLAQQYRGRIVDTPGDNILAEFTSIVDAVNCAVEIQRDLAERNAELAYNRKMEFRIGVNLGDVIEEEGRIYGDGVNIAARVESMAEAGPIQVYRVLSLPGAAAHRVVQAKETLGRKWRRIAISAAVAVVVVGALVIWQFYMRSPTVEPASVDKMAQCSPLTT